MATNSAPFPFSDAIVQAGTRLPTKAFIEWVTQLGIDVDAASARVNDALTKTNQSASLGATALQSRSLSAGLYRVDTYARITQAATVNSSLTVTVGWTENGIALSKSFTAMTGNTTSTVDGNGLLIAIDAASPVTVSTTYASAGATAMTYRLSAVLTEIDA